MNVNEAYLIKGVAEYIEEEQSEEYGEEKEEKEEETCSYHLALMNAKQIRTRNKKIVQKVKLSKDDIDKLGACDDYKEIELKDNRNQMFIASEVMPYQIFEYAQDQRFKQWIGFLFNGIDVNNDQKRIYRVPLKGNEHRCDAYLTTQRF